MPRKSLEQRLAELAARRKTLKARLGHRERARDTRHNVLLGAFLLHRLDQNGDVSAGVPYAPHLIRQSPRKEARQFAASLAAAPDLIFVSPRRRALETAAPIHARFPDTPSTVRPHLTEIVNFSLARFAGASFVERGRHELRYWATCDPDYCDGDDAESFVAFVERVKRELAFLAALKAGNVLVVCHGFFINMVRMLSADPRATDRDLMPRFRPAWHDNPVPNTGVVTFDVDNLQRLCGAGLRT